MPHDAQMFRFPRHLAVLGMVLAFLFFVMALADPNLVFADPDSQHVNIWSWVFVMCIPFCIALTSGYWWRYLLVIGDMDMSVLSFRRRHFLISEITAINVWMGKGRVRVAVITFKSGEKIRIPSYLYGFDQLVALLRERTGLAKPVWE